MSKNIILIGFMGTGKSTISKALAEDTKKKVRDLDAYIEEKEQRSISTIFEQSGEEGFRDLESKYLSEVLEDENQILSCGGGTVLRTENVSHMKEHGIIILLTATAQTIYERVKDNDDRPILQGNRNVTFIQSLMDKRNDIYHAVADVIVATDGKTVDEICQEIKKITISVKNS